MTTLWTVGHSNRDAETLVAMLEEAGIERVADVRAFPRSRRNPQFDADALAGTLAEHGVDYRHLPALGGRRRAGQIDGPSPNGGWRVEGFRNYADYALTRAFAAALAELRALAAERRTAVMCAERHYRQCHRQIIADHLLAAGDRVVHLIDPGVGEPAGLSPMAAVQDDGSVHYPPEQGALF